jgi:hypothetical protein
VATPQSITSYQKKTGSLLFAAITTRPDIAFAVSRLARFNQNPGEEHHKAVDRVIRYLYRTRTLAICYRSGVGISTEQDTEGHFQRHSFQELRVASDASFADNTEDRKSSQGYVIMLFGGVISWRANKQDTVTTSSTKSELLALSQTSKEAIFVNRLLAELSLQLDGSLLIECDNKQTLRLVTEEGVKLVTKLRHVDIHNHWLRQEHAEGRIQVKWIPTNQMMADGFTKALPGERFHSFIRMINLQDIQERLEMETKIEDLAERIRELRQAKP